MREPFRFRFRVRYNECDAQQVVFNARYADYVDLAMTEFMRALGRDYKALLARGIYGGKDLTREFPALGNSALYCVTEIHTKEDIDTLVHALTEVLE